MGKLEAALYVNFSVSVPVISFLVAWLQYQHTGDVRQIAYPTSEVVS